MYTCVVLLIQLSLLDLGRVRAQQQTGLQYEKLSEVHVRGQRSSSGHARVVRDTLEEGLTIDTLPDNMTHLVDSGRYYSWHSFSQEDNRTGELWVDMSDLQQGQVRMHGILSNTHRQAAKVALSFDFPFYGHYLRQVTIATGGFIFMGDITHRMLTATQYIAPLMANFDPSYSKESTVQYLDNGEVFVVQWERVRLQGREAEGAFTFQAALHRTGTITFSYQDIPMSVEVLSSPGHPVKAGLSDAFMVLEPSPLSAVAQRRTVYEYHRVEVDTTKITNHSAFEFTPRPTCLNHDSCELCLSSNLTSGCTWCNVLQRCSDGMDRHRQEWLDYACLQESTGVSCEDYSRGGPDSSISPPGPSNPEATTHSCLLPEGPVSADDTKQVVKYNGKDLKTGHPRQREGSAHTGVIAGVVAAAVLLLALVLLALYVNSHSPSASPVYLIQRRNWPSMTFRKKVLQSSYTQVEFESHEKDPIADAAQC